VSPAHQACDEPWSAGQNATCGAEFGIEKYPPHAYIAAIATTGNEPGLPRQEKSMLFIFSKPNFVQIAWNSQAPRSQSRVRNMPVDSPLGPLGFIRTSNVG
jgi:hypothetical protein